MEFFWGVSLEGFSPRYPELFDGSEILPNREKHWKIYGWNPKSWRWMVQMISGFLPWVIFRFHINFQGCNR